MGIIHCCFITLSPNTNNHPGGDEYVPRLVPIALIQLLTRWYRLRCRDYHGRFHLCVYLLDLFSAQVVPWPDQEY